jgi:hypothetical protein
MEKKKSESWQWDETDSNASAVYEMGGKQKKEHKCANKMGRTDKMERKS